MVHSGMSVNGMNLKRYFNFRDKIHHFKNDGVEIYHVGIILPLLGGNLNLEIRIRFQLALMIFPDGQWNLI